MNGGMNRLWHEKNNYIPLINAFHIKWKSYWFLPFLLLLDLDSSFWYTKYIYIYWEEMNERAYIGIYV